ncbi:hypothetical protein L207DRAFT_520873, partial [Hyaloscypha variabilis F]
MPGKAITCTDCGGKKQFKHTCADCDGTGKNKKGKECEGCKGKELKENCGACDGTGETYEIDS